MSWYLEPGRHSKAARGIKTGCKDRSHPTLNFQAGSHAAPASTEAMRSRYRELSGKLHHAKEDTWSKDTQANMTPAEAREYFKLKSELGIRRMPVSQMSCENKADELIAELKALSTAKEFFARRGNEWDGSKSILIWTGAETEWRDGYYIADLNQGYANPKFTAWLKRHNLEYDWQDAGTIHIYESEGGAI